MGIKVKGEMYCERCDKPISAHKQTWNNNEYWHCPTCGERAVTIRKHEKNQEKERTAAPTVFGVEVVALPRPDKPATAFKNSGAAADIAVTERGLGEGMKRAKAVSEKLGDLPARFEGRTRKEAEALVEKLTKRGAEARLIEPVESASERRPEAGASAAPTADSHVLDQVQKLGELRDAGVLTAEEFESKKTELLSRL
jgi:hypothetical protein